MKVLGKHNQKEKIQIILRSTDKSRCKSALSSSNYRQKNSTFRHHYHRVQPQKQPNKSIQQNRNSNTLEVRQKAKTMQLSQSQYLNNQQDKCFRRPKSEQNRKQLIMIDNSRQSIQRSIKQNIKGTFTTVLQNYKKEHKSKQYKGKHPVNPQNDRNKPELCVTGTSSQLVAMAKSRINIKYIQSFQVQKTDHSYDPLSAKRAIQINQVDSKKIKIPRRLFHTFQSLNKYPEHNNSQKPRAKAKINSFDKVTNSKQENQTKSIKGWSADIDPTNEQYQDFKISKLKQSGNQEIVLNYATLQQNNSLLQKYANKRGRIISKNNQTKSPQKKDNNFAYHTIYQQQKNLGYRERYSAIDEIRCTSLGLSQNRNASFLQKKKHEIMMSQIQKKISQKQCSPRKYIDTAKQSTSNVFKNLGSTRKQAVLGPSSKKVFNAKNVDEDYTYIKRVRAFLDFIFKVNFSNKMYISLKLLPYNMEESQNHKLSLSHTIQIQNSMALSINKMQQSFNPKQNFLQPNMRKSTKGQQHERYKAYVGSGNNCLLIKSILKRRFWIEIVNNLDQQDLMLCWTQNSIQKFHEKQSSKNQIQLQGDKIQAIITAGGVMAPQQKKGDRNKQDRQTIEINKKILARDSAWKVQHFIEESGYKIPFPTNYQPAPVSNHIPGNNCIGSKKKLHFSMYIYYHFLKKSVYDYLPKTYHVTNIMDFSFQKFILENKSSQIEKKKKVWIIKPAEQTNQGTGIRLAYFAQISSILNSMKNKTHRDGNPFTYIVQQYIDKPFLYNGRKFDFRHYIMVTSVNGIIKAYWYKEGYVRTSTQAYDINDLQNIYIHLTNDAIQKKHPKYGHFEPGNKLSYSELQRYLDINYPNKRKQYNIEAILKSVKQMMTDVIKANFKMMDPFRKQNNFEIFGIDFMLDSQFRPWLIEINSNPCLQIMCPLLSRIIPTMIQNSFRIGLDPLLPPRTHYPPNKRYFLNQNTLKNLRYELIFDEGQFTDIIPIKTVELNSYEVQIQQQYDNDGKQLEDIVQI